MNHKCTGDDCQICERQIDEMERNKLGLDQPKLLPREKDSLMERGNPASRYYDGQR